MVGLALIPATASADRSYSLRYGAVERGDIAMASNTIVTCPKGAANCASAQDGTGTVVRNSAWVMVPIDIDGDSTTFDSSRADLRVPAGATILYAGLYWGSDTKAMPEGVDAPNPSARGTVKFAAPDGAGYRTINASTVDSDRFYTSRYQGFADVTSIVRAAGTGTYTVANVQASTGKDQYGGWGLVVAYRDTAKPVRWLGLYDGFREFAGGDPADVSIAGFKTPASGTVRADFGMLSYEGDVGVAPDSARLNGLDLVDALHDTGNYWNARITEYGQYVNTKDPNYVNELGMDANIIRADGFLANNASSALLHMEVSTDLVYPGAMTLVSDQAASAPSNTAAPAISGTARDGQTLTAGNGTWSGTTPMTFAYQWQRCNASGSACSDVAGATSSTYALGSSDVDSTMRVRVTASNVVGPASATSTQTAAVTARPPVNTVAPSITGTARDGQTLTASNGTWTGTSAAFAYRWLRCDSAGASCAAIANATASTYVLTPSDVGRTIRVEVTGSNSGGSAVATSSQTAVVAARAPANTAAPTISGTARDGQTLSATDGTWTGTPTIAFAREWQRCDSSGAACAAVGTAATYALAGADVGSTIRVRVTGTNGVGSASATSDPTAVVAAAAPANTAAPSISGTARDGQTLGSTDGSWTGTAPIAFTRRWMRCDSSGASCSAIAGATGAGYALGASDVGRTIRVEVTAKNSGGSTIATSGQSAVVAADPPASTVAPSISGSARDGQTLTASNGSWTGTPTIGFSHRWLRCDPAGGSCAAIASATAPSYVLTPSDVGKTIRVEVTGTNGGGAASVTSGQTAVVAARPPSNSSAPAVSGTARDGQTLTATDGSWTGTPTINLSREWLRCDSGGATCAVAGTSASYALGPADVGSTIRVRVTGTNGGGTASATSDPTAVVAAAPPANTAAPSISGTARDGQTLSASDGTWTGTPTITFTRRWMRCDSSGSSCASIANATGTSYVLTPSDVGRTVRVEVTGSNGGGSSPASSAQTAVVTAVAPANTAAPSISGTARDGQTLTANDGTWTGTPAVDLDRRWLRCDPSGGACAAIGGATASTYVLTASDVGRTIRVEVTGTNGGGSAVATSGQTAVIAARAPANTAAPVISGTIRDGQSLTANDGTWTGTPTIAFTRQWQRCDSDGFACVDVSTAASYLLTAADVGSTMRVRVTGTNAGGNASATSDPTPVVTATGPASSSPPAISGATRDGQTLTANDGTWTGTPTIEFARRWMRCDSNGSGCAAIPNATGTSYALTPTDVGKTLRLEVTATNGGGTTPATSAATAVVAAAPPANSSAPTVTGTARDAQTLSATDGTWTGTPTISFTRRWLRCDSSGASCAAISSATGATYLLTASDVGRTIRVEVTGANGGGSATVTSAQTGVVAAAPPANTAAPAISGTARDGQTLTAASGTWTGTPTIGFTRQWQRCDSSGGDCSAIGGATGTSYSLTAADVGRTVRVTVTGTNAAGNSAATSPQSAVVAAAAPVNTAAPAVSGTARDGQTLSATDGTWSGTPTIATARQWRRCDSAGNGCEDIASATGSTYALGADDVGHTIRVLVTATNAGGDASTSSARTAVVAAEPPASVGAPSVDGTARDGEVLTSDDGSWTGTAPLAMTHRWLRCNSSGAACAAIDGAAGPAYELTPADIGHAIRVEVTAANGGGTASVTTGATAPVAAGPAINTALPSVTGTARDGQTLSATDGRWTGSPTIAYTHMWRRCDAGGTECSNIPGATAASYDLTAEDVGHTIRVRVTAANGGGQRSADSDATAVVAAIPPSSSTRPELTGTAREGEELALTDGAWGGSAPFDHSYRWERCDADGAGCATIPGASGARYTLVAADAGRRVRGIVTARNPGGSASAESALSDVVAAKPVPPADPPSDPSGDPPSDPSTDSPADPSTDSPADPSTDPPADPSTDPPAGAATLGATQWKSSTGTGLRLRLAGPEPLRTISFAIPRAMQPKRADAGRVVGRMTVYAEGSKPRTFTLRQPRSGGVLLRSPRVQLMSGGVRVSGLPAGVALVKLTLYTRDRTSPGALLTRGHSAALAASIRTAAGQLLRAKYELTR